MTEVDSDQMQVTLPVAEILSSQTPFADLNPRPLGGSREGRPIHGFVLGTGATRVSLIAGCHADEPVGPEMLRRLTGYLSARSEGDPLLSQFTWLIVPDANPDGAARNRVWSDQDFLCEDSTGEKDSAYELASYVRGAVRELPGDDIEFGFPRDVDDRGARPETLAIADFLRPHGPFHIHVSFHGMAFAHGPWFLIDEAWVDRTASLRERLDAQVARMGYRLFDVDRGGEKGFSRIAEGFSTRPNSVAMQRFFTERDDPEMAAKFRPSSMEFVRGLGGDTLTLVSEMPLFLLPAQTAGASGPLAYTPGLPGKEAFQDWLRELVGTRDAQEVREDADREGLVAMPIRDQMRLQLAFLNEGLKAVRVESGLQLQNEADR